jgi:hypothetical protein
MQNAPYPTEQETRAANRQAIFEALSDERDYQDQRWGDPDGAGARELDSFVLYILSYAHKTADLAGVSDSYEERLDLIRKTAALCVAAMEQHGCVPREFEEDGDDVS